MDPEQIPKIDFYHYKSRLANKAMVAEFEKAYAGVNVPYPKDPEGWMSKIEGVEKSAAEALKTDISKFRLTNFNISLHDVNSRR
jgi:agmatine/peptidylarginine deiminase